MYRIHYGGNIPSINNANVKMEMSPITFQNATFVINNKPITIATNTDNSGTYRLTDEFKFEKIDDIEYGPILKFSDLSIFADERIILNANESFPFHLCLMQPKFEILTKFNSFINSSYLTIDPIYKSHVSKIFNSYFRFNNRTQMKNFISLSVKPNVLNSFLFINKLKEILSFIFSEELPILSLELTKTYLDFIETKKNKSSDQLKEDVDTRFKDIAPPIIKFHELCNKFIIDNFSNEQNFINFNDMISVYSNITNIDTSKPTDIQINKSLTKLKQYTPKNRYSYTVYFIKFIQNISDLLNMNKILNDIDQTFNSQNSDPRNVLNIKLSYLFYASFIGLRLKNTQLSFSDVSDKLYPINLENTINNLLGTTRYPETDTINKNIYRSILTFPPLETYSNSTYQKDGKSYTFPDCVENTLLQFLKVITWDSTNNTYNKEYLLSTNDNFKNIFDITDTKQMNQTFINLITNVSDLDIYKKEGETGIKYEIGSTIQNFIRILSYLFDADISEDNLDIIHRNENISSITIIKKQITINIENETYGKCSFIANINDSHSSHLTISDLGEYIYKYDYLNVIILFTTVYSIFSILKFNILERLLQINYNDDDILINSNKLLPLETVINSYNIKIKKVEGKIKKVKKLRKELETSGEELETSGEELKRCDKKLKKYKEELEKYKEEVKQSQIMISNRLTHYNSQEITLIPILKYLLTDYNIYYINDNNKYDINSIFMKNLPLGIKIIKNLDPEHKSTLLYESAIFYNFLEPVIEAINKIKLTNLLKYYEDISIDKLIETNVSDELNMNIKYNLFSYFLILYRSYTFENIGIERYIVTNFLNTILKDRSTDEILRMLNTKNIVPKYSISERSRILKPFLNELKTKKIDKSDMFNEENVRIISDIFKLESLKELVDILTENDLNIDTILADYSNINTNINTTMSNIIEKLSLNISSIDFISTIPKDKCTILNTYFKEIYSENIEIYSKLNC